MDNPKEQNVWFSVSMGLIGLVVGYGIATGLNGGTINLGSRPADANNPSAPTAPTAPQAARSIEDQLVPIAAATGLDATQFKTCLASGKSAALIKSEEDQGVAAGVNGTPGNILYNMKTKTAWLVSGAQPYANFKAAIDAMLANIDKPNFAPPATLQGVEMAKQVQPVDIAKEKVRGNTASPIALIEYSDFQCPFCHRVHPTLQQVMQNYDGKVLWVYRHFPLYQIHPYAEKLAEGSECAQEMAGIDGFWKYADKVMTTDFQ